MKKLLPIIVSIAILIPIVPVYADSLPHVTFNSNPAYQDNTWTSAHPLQITSCVNFLHDNGETNTDLYIINNATGTYIQIDASDDCSYISGQFFSSFTENYSNSAPTDPPETWIPDWLVSGDFTLVYGDSYNPDFAPQQTSHIGDPGVQNVEHLIINNTPRPVPPSAISTLIANGDTVSMVATGKNLAANVSFAGNNFILVWLGVMAASLFALRWWFIALIAIAAIAYFAYRGFRFLNTR